MKRLSVWMMISLLAFLLVTMTMPVKGQSAGTFRSSDRIANLSGEISDCVDGVQESGALYHICLPANGSYNNQLLTWGHGYVAFNEPLQLPSEEICFDDICLQLYELVNLLGFGYAASSYSVNGLAVLYGLEDTVDLVNIYTNTVGIPDLNFMAGGSEGGILTTLELERYGYLFDAGLSLCGPIGNFRQQVNYFGDFRVITDYFFPGVMPGDPLDIPDWLIENWDEYFETVVWPILSNPTNQSKLDQLVAVTKVPYDPTNYWPTLEESIRDALWYNVFATEDAAMKFGGNVYDNMGRWYRGSGNDLLLNLSVQRVAGNEQALENMQALETTGVFDKPQVTMHTTLDQQVQYWHETLYGIKVRDAGTADLRLNIRISRYGHCEFTGEEALAAFALTYFMATGQPLDVTPLAEALPHSFDMNAYQQLLSEFTPR